MNKKITCKLCGNQMTLEDAVISELREVFNEEMAQKEKAISSAMEKMRLEKLELDKKLLEARKNYSNQLAKDRAKITEQVKEDAARENSSRIKMLEADIAKKNAKITEIEETELKLIKKQEDLAEELRKFDLTVAKKVAESKEKIFTQAKEKASDELSVKLTYLENELKNKEDKLKETQKLELDIIKERREMGEKRRTFELEVAKNVEAELEKARSIERLEVLKEYKLKDLEKDKKIEGLLKEITKLQDMARQGSQKFQGDVLEDDLATVLQNMFPMDKIEPVPNGVNGADIIQIIISPEGQECGKLVWETKNTKNWKDGWISKFKIDVREVKGDVAILLTSTLPKDVNNFKCIDGVWVTNYECFQNLAVALRGNIIKIYQTKILATGQNQKSEMIFKYLASNEFNQKVEAAIETLTLMSANLGIEKKAMAKLWAERQKQIEYTALNVSSLFGNIKGIVGKELKDVNNLKLLPFGEKQTNANSNLEEIAHKVYQ